MQAHAPEVIDISERIGSDKETVWTPRKAHRILWPSGVDGQASRRARRPVRTDFFRRRQLRTELGRSLGIEDQSWTHCAETDRPIAGLIKDLKSRGLFDSTLIVWHGEFGRLPIGERLDGRDHNNLGFSVWLAGAGVKGGSIVGATDDFGYRAIENKKSIYELHATILHLMGLDYNKLTYRFNGRDMRLTDVHGQVIKEILA